MPDEAAIRSYFARQEENDRQIDQMYMFQRQPTLGGPANTALALPEVTVLSSIHPCESEFHPDCGFAIS
jgi:hypothetical protein